MRDQYEGWEKSSHRSVATCADCHMPHAFPANYLVKGENGFRHSLAFTTMRFHEPIQITPGDLKVTEGACRYCHAAVVANIDRAGHGDGERITCVRCHRSAGHLH